eukprot:TRINITY_DN64918_c0_g1_i1.p1 TRINITY_DN64918_c0_g1~~TRINITY_DN64918_c0_g1_i1.p1  ORF type:complete len:321 (+),score=56.70 TRINITY_DN64918_c0_g1_i1:51-1013(+)
MTASMERELRIGRDLLIRHRRAAAASGYPGWSGRLLTLDCTQPEVVTPEKSNPPRHLADDDGGLTDEPVADRHSLEQGSSKVGCGSRGGRKSKSQKASEAEETAPTMIHPWKKDKLPEPKIIDDQRLNGTQPLLSDRVSAQQVTPVAELLALLSDSSEESSEESEMPVPGPAAVPTSNTCKEPAIDPKDDLSRFCKFVNYRPVPHPRVNFIYGGWHDSLGNLVSVHPDWTVSFVTEKGPKYTKLSQDELGRLWCGSYYLHQVGYNEEPLMPACLAWRTTRQQRSSIWRRRQVTPPGLTSPELTSPELTATRHSIPKWRSG